MDTMMLLNRSNRTLELDYEKSVRLSGLLLVQLGVVATGHNFQLDTECDQHLCALTLGSVYDLCGLEYIGSGSDQRHMVCHG
jgi:hypothetical protein